MAVVDKSNLVDITEEIYENSVKHPKNVRQTIKDTRFSFYILAEMFAAHSAQYSEAFYPLPSPLREIPIVLIGIGLLGVEYILLFAKK